MNKQSKKSAYIFFLLLFILFISLNCRQEQTTETQDLANLLWSAEKINIIGILDLGSSQDEVSKNYPLSLGKDERIHFRVSRPGTYFMRLWKRRNYSSIPGKGNISVFINGRKIKEIAFHTQEFIDCYVCWSMLQKGENTLSFTVGSHDSAVSPEKFFDSVEIGLVVNSLEKFISQQSFRRFAKVKKGIIQKQGSYLNYYFRVTSGMSLQLGYYLIDPDDSYDYLMTGLSVGLTDQQGHFSPLLEVTSEEASPQSISLDQYAGQIIRLTFRVVTSNKVLRSKPQVRWSEPALVVPLYIEESTEEKKALLPRASPAQRNVFWIVLDALNAKHLSCYGYPFKTTPNIDTLASEGIQFNHAYTQGVNTNISLASMFTSLYPETTRVWGYRLQLDEKAETIAEILEKHKMQTTVISDHIGLELSNLLQGFVEKILLEGDVIKGRTSFYRKTLDYFNNLSPSPAGNFVYIHFMSPHSPYLPPEPYRSLFDKDYKGSIRGTQKTLQDINKGKFSITERDIQHLRALYDGNLNYVDHMLGEIFKTLQYKDLYDDSLIIITSDHGEGLLEHGYLFHNPYVYEESIHVPLILKFPKSYNIGPRKIETLVELIDLYPTILDYIGIEYQPNLIQGKSLIPLMKDISGYSKQVIYSRGHGKIFSFSARFGNDKYLYNAQVKCDELYDITQDPEERDNLASAHPYLTGYYKMRALRWIFQQWSAGQGLALPKKYSKEDWERLKSLGYLK